MKSLTVKNIEQKIIFCCEMQGQISDGQWENAKPNNHYEVWSSLKWDDVKIDDIIGTHEISHWEKRNYNFSKRELLEIVGDQIRFKIVLLKLHPNKQLFLEMLKNDEYAIPDSGHEFTEIENKTNEDYYAKKFETMKKYGLTKDLCIEANRLKDSLYSYKQLREDCKGLKTAIRTWEPL